MNLRIARKILKNILYTRSLKYSAQQIEKAVLRVRKHQPARGVSWAVALWIQAKRPECDACGTFIDKFYPDGMPSGMVPPGLCADCYQAAGIQPEHDPREGGGQWAS